MKRVPILLAICVGVLIAWVDSRPNWDDTGITAMSIFVSCGLFGALGPRHPWLWALSVGVWIPFWGIAEHQNFGSLLALVFAFVGSYAGMFLRTSLMQTRTSNT